jgi:peptidyl-prolyl isomerase D
MFFLESIRYLDVHPDFSEISPELKDSFESLLAPLLLNSALAAIRSEPPSPEVALQNSTRALTTLQLSKDDKGKD